MKVALGRSHVFMASTISGVPSGWWRLASAVVGFCACACACEEVPEIPRIDTTFDTPFPMTLGNVEREIVSTLRAKATEVRLCST